MKTMQVELAGRYRLTSELLAAGVNVALPVFDSGIDLIAYVEARGALTARPIQMKAASSRSFGVDRKYAKSPDLIIAYVWGVNDAAMAATFAMTYREAAILAKKLGWAGTPSWQRGGYVTTKPSRKILQMLEPYCMSPKRWHKLFARKGKAITE